jgi:hypothetical protein
MPFPLPYPNVRKWTGFIWLWIGYSGGLVTTQYNTGFYVRWRIPLPPQHLSLQYKENASWSPLIFICMHTNIIAKVCVLQEVFFIKIN